MKAKTLLKAAAALAAGVMTSQAQVYSQNIVGYINVPLTGASGYNLVANQLDLDGTGTNNSIYTTVGTNLPDGTIVEAWNGTSFKPSTLTAGVWSLNNAVITNSMNPGSGFFIFVPGLHTNNVTFVGNVITGTNTYTVTKAYQISSSSGPVAGAIDTGLLYAPNAGDIVETWNGSSFKPHTYNSPGSWTGGDPSLIVGQAVFMHPLTTPESWTQILNVQ
jgi:hypothetical protein